MYVRKSKIRKFCEISLKANIYGLITGFRENAAPAIASKFWKPNRFHQDEKSWLDKLLATDRNRIGQALNIRKL